MKSRIVIFKKIFYHYVDLNDDIFINGKNDGRLIFLSRIDLEKIVHVISSRMGSKKSNALPKTKKPDKEYISIRL